MKNQPAKTGKGWEIYKLRPGKGPYMVKIETGEDRELFEKLKNMCKGAGAKFTDFPGHGKGWVFETEQLRPLLPRLEEIK